MRTFAQAAGGFAVGFAVLVAGCAGTDPAPQTPPASVLLAPQEPPAPGTATAATRAANAAVAERLALTENSDLADAARGFLAKIDADAIVNANGDVVWPIAEYAFIDGQAPDTVNPSLWRQGKLTAMHGLFEVADGIYQVRGYDLSVMSIIEGDTGWIIVDPLTAVETARASLKLVNDTLGERPVSAVLYTHSHADHFGGVRGVISDDDVARGVPVYAPIGFAEHAVAENLLAGNHMSRRASLMFGLVLPRSEHAHVSSGLGPGLPNGTVSLILPTEELAGRGTRRTIDGVLFEFIDAAGTEAPAEFMFYLPEKRALCTAEVATATLHNVLTPRGAKVRDALGWSQAIDHLLVGYGDRSDVVFASHHWPTWGQENVQRFLQGQRDVYKYIHDQTLRLANAGKTMTEVAEAVEEPLVQLDRFDTRGYYGTLNHNAKAVYQYYFGWWGGVMSDYYQLPHEQTAKRYVAAMGGSDAVVALGSAAFADGDYRWAAELFNHVVFADPAAKPARLWLAATYEQLGFQSESGTWRSYFLAAATELRDGPPKGRPLQLGSPDFLRAVPSIDLFNAFATRFNPKRLTTEPFVLQFEFPDRDETLAVHVGPSTIVPRAGHAEDATAVVIINRADLDSLALRAVSVETLIADQRLVVSGDPNALGAFFATLEQPEFWFNTQMP